MGWIKNLSELALQACLTVDIVLFSILFHHYVIKDSTPHARFSLACSIADLFVLSLLRLVCIGIAFLRRGARTFHLPLIEISATMGFLTGKTIDVAL